MQQDTIIKPKGDIQCIIEYENNEPTECFETNNIVLRSGREALASSLANQIDDVFDYFVSRMIFGDQGANSGVPKLVDSHRSGLFGVTRVSKPVIATIDPDIRSQVVFTSVIPFSEGNGYTLNEMALVMENNDLYSMATFPDLNKTSSMQITWNWRLSFV